MEKQIVWLARTGSKEKGGRRTSEEVVGLLLPVQKGKNCPSHGYFLVQHRAFASQLLIHLPAI